jgi:murein DD-endopeptidase MepM/ murein hydrolase activator NlpD
LNTWVLPEDGKPQERLFRALFYIPDERQGDFMAIDPATAKAIAKVAASVLTDKETRSKLFYIILIAVACGVAVILIPIYLLTHPMEMLKAAFADSPDEAAYIEQYKLDNDDKVLVIDGNPLYEGDYPLPVKGASITSSYGERSDPFTGQTSFHYGTDFGGAWQSELYAVADGVVVKVCTEKNDGYGNYIIIKNTGQRTNDAGGIETETFYTLYGHMNEVYMFEGQSVKKGAVIGLMGGDPDLDTNPGRSTGTHLHFEVRTSQYGSGIDPAGYIFPEPEPPESTESEETTNE